MTWVSGVVNLVVFVCITKMRVSYERQATDTSASERCFAERMARRRRIKKSKHVEATRGEVRRCRSCAEASCGSCRRRRALPDRVMIGSERGDGVPRSPQRHLTCPPIVPLWAVARICFAPKSFQVHCSRWGFRNGKWEEDISYDVKKICSGRFLFFGVNF